MATRTEQALIYFDKGYNCAQAIIAAFGPSYGMAAEQGLLAGAGFGIGMGGSRLTCGAVSGAVLVLGLAFGSSGRLGNRLSTGKVNRRVREFIREFESRCGSTECAVLLGNRRGAGKGPEGCGRFVRAAAEALEKVLAE